MLIIASFFSCRLKNFVYGCREFFLYLNITYFSFRIPVFQIINLFNRAYRVYFRDPQLLRTVMFQSIMFAIFIIILYNNMTSPNDNTPVAIQDRAGALQTITSIPGFAGVTSTLQMMMPLMPVFFRDYHSRLYGRFSFFGVSQVYTLPVWAVSFMIYQIVFWWVINIKSTAYTFGMIYVINMACYFASSGYGTLISMMFSSVEMANQMFPILIVPFFMLSGFTVKLSTVSPYLWVYSFLSIFKYPFQAALLLEYEDADIKRYQANCRLPVRGSDQTVKVPNGNQIPACNPMENYDFVEDSVWLNIVVMLVLAFASRILAYVLFVLKTKNKKAVKSPIPDNLIYGYYTGSEQLSV